ncbi:MAG: hydantoinase/oxoprolinase N-terminal domain-containing protein [Planctomycetota bacterium]
MIVLGVDIRGAFTDFVMFDGKKLKIIKIISTPHNPAEAVFNGIGSLKMPERCLHWV